MAAIKFIKRTISLDGGPVTDPSPNAFFDGEQGAHTFIIAAVRGGQPLMLSGAVSATFLNPNDAVVSLSGSVVDGAAVVTLSNDCYALSGPFTLTISVNGAVVYECQSRVRRRSSSTAYDPSGEISVATLSALIAEMRTATTAANTAAANAQGVADTLAGDTAALKAGLKNVGGNLLENETLSPGSRGGMNFTPVTGGGIIVDGTQSAMTFYNLYSSGTDYPTWLQKGAFYSVSMTGEENQSSPKVVIDIYGYNGTSTQEILLGAPIGSGPYVWYVPPTTDYAGLIIRIRVNSAISNYHAQVYPKIERLNTKQYIPKPFNSADITPAVVAALTNYNEVEFGPGTFEITQAITLPNGAVVHGQGENSVLKPVNIEYVFNISRENEVFGLCFNGGDSSVSIDRPGYGSGLYYYRATQDESTDGKISFVHNCWFKNLPYSGIRGQNTGGGTNEGLHVDSCYFEHCWCAINIYLRSEYWAVSNCAVYDCTFGVINDGGNNKFVNCTFRTNGTAFYLNTEGAQIYNDGHGQCIGCTFNHIGGNGGTAIRADRLLNGYTFIGCHFFYSVINISNSKGVHIVGCTLGQSTPQITVTGSYPAFFEDCVFTVTPTLNLNASTKVVGCYTFDGDPVTNG